MAINPEAAGGFDKSHDSITGLFVLASLACDLQKQVHDGPYVPSDRLFAEVPGQVRTPETPEEIAEKNEKLLGELQAEADGLLRGIPVKISTLDNHFLMLGTSFDHTDNLYGIREGRGSFAAVIAGVDVGRNKMLLLPHMPSRADKDMVIKTAVVGRKKLFGRSAGFGVLSPLVEIEERSADRFDNSLRVQIEANPFRLR